MSQRCWKCDHCRRVDRVRRLDGGSDLFVRLPVLVTPVQGARMQPLGAQAIRLAQAEADYPCLREGRKDLRQMGRDKSPRRGR